MLQTLNKYSYSNNKLFYQNLKKIAIPMGIASFFGSLLNMIDTLMISSLGDVSIAAVGSSNKLFFLMIVTLFGVYSGFGVFVSQYWGKKDIKRLQTIYMTAIITGIFISSIVSLIAIILPKQVLNVFSDNHEVIKVGVSYLRIVSLSFILSSLLFSVEMVSRSTENVKLPMFVATTGVVINTVLNYLLIFGNFGFKEMGVEGAAIATVISRIIQLVIYIIYILITKNPVLFLKISNIVFDKQLFKKIFMKSLPVVGNEFFWSLGIITIFAAYGRKGTEALASMQLFDTMVGLLTVFTWGIANSAAIMIGKKIGEKDIEEAKWYVKLFIFNSIFFGIITGFIILSTIPFIPVFFKSQSLLVIHNIQYLLLVFALYMPFNLLAATFIVGILRSGGDTAYAFLFEVTTLWGYSVPAAWFLALFTSFTIPLIYFIITFELVIKDLMCFMRYKSGKYIHNLVH